MKVFYSNKHRLHDPLFEVFDGGRKVPYLESPERIDKILLALEKSKWAELVEPLDFGIDPILAVHDPGYINFLEASWGEWVALEQTNDTPVNDLVLLPATFALRRQPHIPASVLGRAGYYIMDLSACIVKGTYEAARSAANCALSGAKMISTRVKTSSPLNKELTTAFALCRPPGHHAGKDYAAGYCFINNAAVAANWLSTTGKVAILDVDYHACNGTQDIFYDRSDVLTISIHGDPSGEYPYYSGYLDEVGIGDGYNYHHNFPLPPGTDDENYLAALAEAINLIQKFKPNYLIVSVGADIYKDDPLGRFKITTEGFNKIGREIADLALPTLIVMEGGYNNDALGDNIVSFLSTFN
jgi:acetoin utilization deacetylase AcuC-like enzyme